MTDIMKIAEGVAKHLADYDATVQMAPEFTLEEAKILRVVVVPIGVTHHILSRTHMQIVYRLQVGILKRASEDDLARLVAFCTDLANGFLDKNVLGARCMKSEHVPLYVPEHLTERHQFTGIVELTFNEIIQR